MYTLKINSSRGPLAVSWQDVATLAKFSNLQSGFYLTGTEDYGLDLFYNNFQQWNQTFWSLRETQGMLDFPKDAKIADIGSGVAVIDLLLYSYIPNSKFYLIDDTSEDIEWLGSSLPDTPYTDHYPVYNSWAPVNDAITSSGFDITRFVMYNTDFILTEEVDAITSYFSWCFHYPKDVYWNRVIPALKKYGKLILDIRPLHNKDVIGEISEELKSEPVMWKFPYVGKHIDNFNHVEDTSGYRCMWIKK